MRPSHGAWGVRRRQSSRSRSVRSAPPTTPTGLKKSKRTRRKPPEATGQVKKPMQSKERCSEPGRSPGVGGAWPDGSRQGSFPGRGQGRYREALMSPGLRILLVTRHRAVVGGVESYLRTLLPLLQARGHAPGLLFEHDAGPGQTRIDEGLDLPVWSLAALGRQGALAGVAAWRPERVYQQGVQDLDLEEALLERYPALLFLHAYYGTCISGMKRHAFPRPVPCERVLGPACLVHYLPRRCGGRSPITALREYHYQQRRLALIRRYGTVLVGSRAMREEYLRHGLSESQVVCVSLFGDGTPDPELPAPRPPSGQLLMVGRLTELKGGVELVRALPVARAALGRELELVVAGDGPERPRIQQEAAARRVPVRFAGWVDRAAREQLMRQADLLAVPSVWPEPFGLVGVEAGGVGLPAVAFAVGGIPDWCQPGVSGELAPGNPPTPEGLAGAIVRALSDAGHHARLREGAWRMARRFNAEAHVDALCEHLAPSPSGRGRGVRV
ncbi:glycosyltransferase family 4 protein [Archangium violaceum]|nr:glycosyltransferase family 4 protein [Archangium violaceum]